MPLHQSLLIFVLALTATLALAIGSEALRADLRSPRVWLSVLAVAIFASAASAVVGETRHSGTGFTTSYGWPKPFHFLYLTESGVRTSGLSAVYFMGNVLAYAGPLLALWSFLRLVRR